MPIVYSEMMKKTRTIEMKFQGETVNITYRINVVTQEFLETVRSLPGDESVRTQLVTAVESWDVLDDAGQALPLTDEILKRLPTEFNNAVLKAIADDMENPGDEEKKD